MECDWSHGRDLEWGEGHRITYDGVEVLIICDDCYGVYLSEKAFLEGRGDPPAPPVPGGE
jgi:hypothetical protein